MAINNPPVTVQSVVCDLIERSGKTQREIAEEMGFTKPNVLSMIKNGQTKLPLEKAAALAVACGGDPVFLVRLVLSEYHPAIWSALVAALGLPLTQSERCILEIYRCIDPQEKLAIDEPAKRRVKALFNQTDGPDGPDQDDPVAAMLRKGRAIGR